MTTQKHRFIELSDLLSLRFVCKREGCGATLLLPFRSSAFQNKNAFGFCPFSGVSGAV
jgi:hypothetical protein